jgi:hypothetical protein
MPRAGVNQDDVVAPHEIFNRASAFDHDDIGGQRHDGARQGDTDRNRNFALFDPLHRRPMLGEISLHLGDLLGLEAGAVPPLPSTSALPPPLVPLLPPASALPPPGPVLPSASALPPLCPVLPPASALPSWSADLPALLPSCSARWPGNPVLQQGSGLCVPNCPARRQVLSPSSLDRRGCAVDLSKRNGLTPEEKNRCSKEPGFSSRDGLASTRSTGRAISLTTSTCAQAQRVSPRSA